MTEQHEGMRRAVGVKAAVINEKVLELACRVFRGPIREGATRGLPDIIIRYVKEQGRFGYTRFGDCYFREGHMYIFERDNIKLECGPEWYTTGGVCPMSDLLGEGHSRFGHGREVIFAGVRTPFTDGSGDHIFTGDIVELHRGCCCGVDTMPMDMLPDDEHGGYAFIADNHSLPLTAEYCRMAHRVGTVFFQLENLTEEPPRTVARRCVGIVPMEFGAEPMEDILQRSRYTPNFDKEEWKYPALEILGIEPYWQK